MRAEYLDNLDQWECSTLPVSNEEDYQDTEEDDPKEEAEESWYDNTTVIVTVTTTSSYIGAPFSYEFSFFCKNIFQKYSLTSD